MADVKPLKIDPAGPGVPERMETGDTVGVASGGTGQTSIAEGAIPIGTTGNAFTTIGPGTVGQIPTSTGTTITMQDPAVTADLVLTNGNVAVMAPGCPVYETVTALTVDKARANAISTSQVVGLTIASISASATGTVRSSGPVTLTTGEWDAITGGTGGLTIGSRYYLDPSTAGKLTLTPTDSTGNFLVEVGKALSTLKMLVAIRTPVGL